MSFLKSRKCPFNFYRIKILSNIGGCLHLWCSFLENWWLNSFETWLLRRNLKSSKQKKLLCLSYKDQEVEGEQLWRDGEKVGKAICSEKKNCLIWPRNKFLYLFLLHSPLCLKVWKLEQTMVNSLISQWNATFSTGLDSAPSNACPPLTYTATLYPTSTLIIMVLFRVYYCYSSPPLPTMRPMRNETCFFPHESPLTKDWLKYDSTQ